MRGGGGRPPPRPVSLLLGGLRLRGIALGRGHHHEALPRTSVLALARVLRRLAVAVALARVHALALDLRLGAARLGVRRGRRSGQEQRCGRRGDQHVSTLHGSRPPVGVAQEYAAGAAVVSGSSVGREIFRPQREIKRGRRRDETQGMADHLTPDERRFRALASSSVERIAELDARGRTVYVSPNHASSGDDVLASIEHVHADDRSKVAAHFAAAFGDGSAQRASFRVTDASGATRWVEATLTPVLAEDGERHVLVVSRDVSEARELEQNVRESRERFQLIAENAYDMISEYDSRWQLKYANDQVRVLLGLSAASPAFDASTVHPDDLERVTAMFAGVIRGEEESSHSTYRIRRADGTWCWIDGTLRSFEQRAGER